MQMEVMHMYEDFEKAIKHSEVIQNIIMTANNLNDSCDLGFNETAILKDNELIDEAIYDTFAAK